MAWRGGLWVEEQREVRITTLEQPAEEPVLVEAASTTLAPSWILSRETQRRLLGRAAARLVDADAHAG